MRRAVTVLFVYLSGLLVCATVIFVFLYIFVKGAQVISWRFISTGPEGIPPGTAGGIFPAIVGSLMSGAVAAVISSITAVATTVWLTFFLPKPRPVSFLPFLHRMRFRDSVHFVGSLRV